LEIGATDWLSRELGNQARPKECHRHALAVIAVAGYSSDTAQQDYDLLKGAAAFIAVFQLIIDFDLDSLGSEIFPPAKPSLPTLPAVPLRPSNRRCRNPR
jgi:hypothetical protein